MNLAVEYRNEGEQTVFRERLAQILDECPELLWQSTRAESWSRICYATESMERVEIVVRDTLGVLLGFAVVVDDDDSHVGPCLGVQWRYVFPEARGAVGRQLQREIVKFARECNYQIVAYTKRLGEGRYEINYKQLKEKPNGQEN